MSRKGIDRNRRKRSPRTPWRRIHRKSLMRR
jgi:hypothetical protein